MFASRDAYTLGGRSGERPPGFARTRRVVFVVTAYAAVGGVAIATAAALGRNPFTCDAWLGVAGPAAWLISLGFGVVTGAATIAATHAMVRRWSWARELFLALRPSVHRSADGALAAVALASALGEELLFRGLMVPIAGVFASSIVFGALHQVRGRARWPWMAWATVMGLVFGAVFAATGSLVGPLVAHAAINHANLRFLRDGRPPRRRLGGLLEQR